MRKAMRLSPEQSLEAVPVKNEMVSETRCEDGRLMLVLSRKKSLAFGILSKFFVIPQKRTVSLDEMGTWVWEKCDGTNTVGRIVKDLTSEYKVTRKEAQLSLMSFLKSLSSKKLIGFVLNRNER